MSAPISAELRKHIREERDRAAREEIKATQQTAIRSGVHGNWPMDDLRFVKATAELTVDQREAFIDHRCIGHTLTMIGERMGYTREYVRQLCHRAEQVMFANLPVSYFEDAVAHLEPKAAASLLAEMRARRDSAVVALERSRQRKTAA